MLPPQEGVKAGGALHTPAIYQLALTLWLCPLFSSKPFLLYIYTQYLLKALLENIFILCKTVPTGYI